MKKKIIKYLTGIAVLLCINFITPSCDVLDIDPTGWYSENVAFASLENLDLYVKNFYGVFYANADINANGNLAMDDGVTDLVKYSWYILESGMVNRFFYTSNFVTAESNFRSNWSDMYTRIRTMNEYFYDLSKGYGSNLDYDQLKIRTAEVRFMRAFAYQELTLRHGGVILRISENSVDGPNERAQARATEEQCWNFIIDEYEKAAKDLPEKWATTETGRLTKGAAKGMKARAQLYAKRWGDAVQTCNEVLAMGYSLLPGITADDYYKIFTTANNSELLLPVYFQQGIGLKQHSYDSHFCPPYDGSPFGASVGAAATPSDEYASSFDIKVNGNFTSFDWNDLSDYNNQPWTNREPRFYASILYNGANWKERTLQLYEGGTDGYMDYSSSGQDGLHRTTTGYIFRKFMSDDSEINFTSILSGQYWIEMRLAEIYLIRSEAYARQNKFDNAYADLKTIRDRVGLPPLSQKGNWNDYLEDLAKERICELGLEGHRYHDLIRWGIARQTLDGKRLHAIKITKSGDNFTYNRVECDTQDRLFPEKYTIFPIPATEIKNNALCEQNSLWK